MQGQAARRAGDPPGQGEDPSSEGLGGHDLLTQTDAGCPASQVMRHHLNRQPGAVGGKTAGRQVVQPDAVLEVAYGVLDLGVAAVIGLQLQGFSVPVGDEAVIAVGGEEGQLGTGRGLHPSDDEPYRRGVRLGLEGGVELVSEVFSRTNVVIKTASNYLAADGDDGVGIEAAVGPHRELSPGPGVAHPPHRLAQEVGGAPCGVGAALAQPGHQHVPGAGGDGQQRVIAPLAGIAVVARALLGQTVAELCPYPARAEATNW